MINGVAFAGITGAGKSILFKMLSTKLVSMEHTSLLILRNNLVQTRVYEHLRREQSLADLSIFLNQPLLLMDHLQQVAQGWPSNNKINPRTIVLFESWLLNLCAELGLKPKEHFEALDERRASVGLAIIHLHFPPGLVAERSVILTRRYRGVGWGRYLDALGADVDAQAAEFRRRQSEIARLFALCRSPRISIDTSDMEWSVYAAKILAYMGL
jgi:hypothetical protein